MAIRWDVSKEDFRMIFEIVERAAAMAIARGRNIDRTELLMDLEACHCNGTPLDLAGLLAAAPLDFTHDIYGIVNHIDRSTGKLSDFFVPRYAAKQAA